MMIGVRGGSTLNVRIQGRSSSPSSFSRAVAYGVGAHGAFLKLSLLQEGTVYEDDVLIWSHFGGKPT